MSRFGCPALSARSVAVVFAVVSFAVALSVSSARAEAEATVPQYFGQSHLTASEGYAYSNAWGPLGTKRWVAGANRNQTTNLLPGYFGPMDAKGAYLYWYQGADAGGGKHAIGRAAIYDPLGVVVGQPNTNFIALEGSGAPWSDGVVDIEVGGGYIYWLTAGISPVIWRANIDGTGAAPWNQTGGSSVQIAANGEFVVWSDDGLLRRVAHDVNPASAQVIPPSIPASSPMDVDETHVYWHQSQKIRKFPFGGTAADIEDVASAISVTAIAATGGKVVWDVMTLSPQVMPAQPFLTSNPAGPDGDNGWFRTRPRFTLTVQGSSGSGPVNLRLGGRTQPWLPVSPGTQINTSQDGSNFLIEYSILTGGGSYRKFAQFKVDTVPPVTSYEYLATLDGDEGEVNDDTGVELTAEDVTSGVAGTEYTIDGGEPQEYFQPLLLDPCTSLEYRSTDIAGNVEAWNSLYIGGGTCEPSEEEEEEVGDPGPCEGGGEPPCEEPGGECEAGGVPPCEEPGGECEGGGEPPCEEPGEGDCEEGAEDCGSEEETSSISIGGSSEQTLPAKRRNAKIAVKIRIENSGSTPVGQAIVCAKVPKAKLKLRGKRCVTISPDNAGMISSRTVFRFRLKSKLKGKTAKVRFTITDSDGNTSRYETRIRQSRA